MRLWKKLFDVEIGGKNKVAKGAELNFDDGSSLKMAGTAVTATADELNRSTDASARVVTTTATTLNLTVTQHAERVVFVNTTSTLGATLTLPVATGSGAKFTVVNNVVQTQCTVIVAANGTTDTVSGVAVITNTTITNMAEAFVTSATSDKVTFNYTTTGGKGYDMVEAYDVAANAWHVQVRGYCTGTAATPFSQT